MKNFDKSRDKIIQIFKDYSPEDIAEYLFICTSWKNNRSSCIKYKLLTVIFLSLSESDFLEKKNLKNFKDFKELFKNLSKFLPSFPMYEDFCPENDWGEVQYYYEDKSYSILYGCELDYDFAQEFEIIFRGIGDIIKEATNESPILHLSEFLRLSHFLINSTPTNKELKETLLSNGHNEIPEYDFWKEAKKVFLKFNIDYYESSFVNRFTTSINNLKYQELTQKNFIHYLFTGELVNSFFVSINNKEYPLSPRWFLRSLIDSWSLTLKSIKKKLKRDILPLPIKIGVETAKFARSRLKEENIFLLGSAANLKGHQEQFIFPLVIQSKHKIFFVSFLSPFLDKFSLKEGFNYTIDAIDKAKSLFQSQMTIALHLEKQFMSYKDAPYPNPEFILVIPHVSTIMGSFEIPKNLDAKVFFLEHFLGILDELDSTNELEDFFEYEQNAHSSMKISSIEPLNMFASFKDSSSVIIQGAVTPDLLIIDPHWGTSFRYKSIKNFWENFPEDCPLGHPRSWKMLDSGGSYQRLIHKSFMAFAATTKVNKTSVIVNSPFHKMEMMWIRISRMIAECVCDYLSSAEIKVHTHKFFKNKNRLQIFLFPSSLLKDSDFVHLKHLEPKGSWNTDITRIPNGRISLRVVFDEEYILKIFSNYNDSTAEVSFAQMILNCINNYCTDKSYSTICKKLDKLKNKKPGYTVALEPKRASFPENVRVSIPEEKHFKLVRKRIAEIAFQSDFSPGEYDLKDAKLKVDKLLNEILNELKFEIEKHNYEDLIKYSIPKIDALTHEDEVNSLENKYIPKREIRYDIANVKREQNQKFTTYYRNYQFFLEETVRLSPNGKDPFNEERFKYLIALVDWFYSFANTSDQIHHDFFPTGIEIESEYVVNVKIPSNITQAQNEFGKYLSKRKINLLGDKNDVVHSPRPIKEFLNEIDKAFLDSLKFRLSSLESILVVLANYASYAEVEESSYYSEEIESIWNVCKEKIEDLDKDEFNIVIDFLILKHKNLLKIIGSEKPSDKLPFWENYKRHTRYTIRPLILIKDKIIWGPYSAMKTANIWSKSVRSGKLPINLECPEIDNVISNEKSLFEKELENKAFEVIQRFTNSCESNLFLHKRFKKEDYPDSLGDYDVLAYLENENVLISLECKHLLQVSCLKDSRDLREELFGKKSFEKSYFGKVNKRHEYLKKNHKKIANSLGWKIKKSPKIISAFVSIHPYWWTYYPPVKTEIHSLTIDELNEFIDNLK